MEMLSTFDSTISDSELWRCAQQQINQHGVDAVIVTYYQRAALARARDVEGVNTWSAIELRVLWLRRHRPAGTTVH